MDMLSFPIVPNMSAMWRRVNPEECNLNKRDLSVLVKVCSGDEKSKSSDITMQCLYGVFSKSSLLTCDSFH